MKENYITDIIDHPILGVQPLQDGYVQEYKGFPIYSGGGYFISGDLKYSTLRRMVDRIDMINDHIELYKLYFDDWNNEEPYTPSILFGWQEKVFKYLQDNSFLDENDALKYILKVAFGFAGVVFLICLWKIW